MTYYSDEYLSHYGIAGMKWGIRRYQNEDGSLTAAGIARYTKGANKLRKMGTKIEKKRTKADKLQLKSDKYEYKSASAWTTRGSVKKHKKSVKLSVKASRNRYKATKLENKGKKYAQKLMDEYKDYNMSELDRESYEYVDRWIKRSLK